MQQRKDIKMKNKKKILTRPHTHPHARPAPHTRPHARPHRKFPARWQVENQTVQRPVAVRRLLSYELLMGHYFQGLYDLATPHPPRKPAAGEYGYTLGWAFIFNMKVFIF
jgi:hypothetical protein